MTDINPIILWLPINIVNTIVFIVFVLWLYFLSFYLKQNKKVEKKSKTNFWKVQSVDIYKKQLLDLEKNINIDKYEFYKNLANILKWILEYYGAKNISKMTLEEINNLKLKQNLKELIKNVYFKEYARDTDDSKEIRKDLILEVKKLIK